MVSSYGTVVLFSLDCIILLLLVLIYARTQENCGLSLCYCLVVITISSLLLFIYINIFFSDNFNQRLFNLAAKFRASLFF